MFDDDRQILDRRLRCNVGQRIFHRVVPGRDYRVALLVGIGKTGFYRCSKGWRIGCCIQPVESLQRLIIVGSLAPVGQDLARHQPEQDCRCAVDIGRSAQLARARPVLCFARIVAWLGQGPRTFEYLGESPIIGRQGRQAAFRRIAVRVRRKQNGMGAEVQVIE